MSTGTEKLLQEFVGRWARGEPLAVDELLAHAGPHADELADLIDTFLQRAPPREPTPEALAYVRSLNEPSLLHARQEKRLKLDDLAALLADKLGLPRSARAKVRRYYQELELGQLEPSRVAASVWEALSGLLGSDARGLADTPPTAMSAPAMYRETHWDYFSVRQTHSLGADRLYLGEDWHERRGMPETRPEPDEVDRLFGIAPPS